MPRLILPVYTVVRDTREKDVGNYWDFLPSRSNKRPPLCAGTIEQGLKTGDYSLQGYENLLTIERKAGMSELWTNYLNDKDRIIREFERMRELKYRYVFVETELTREAFELSPSQVKTKMPGKVVIDWLLKLGDNYRVPIMFVGACGKQASKLIFEMVVNKEKSLWVPQQ